MKRLLSLLSVVFLLSSCDRVVTVRTSCGRIVEASAENVTVKAGQKVSLITVTGNLYRILPTRQATGVKTIDSTDLYIMQGTVMQAN